MNQEDEVSTYIEGYKMKQERQSDPDPIKLTMAKSILLFISIIIIISIILIIVLITESKRTPETFLSGPIRSDQRYDYQY